MKVFYILLIFITLFIGCAPIRTMGDFSSANKFYEDFNESAANKSVKITMTNDSAITSLYGAKITGDSLFFVEKVEQEKLKIYPDEIQKINYYGSNPSSLSADILLKSGKELKVDGVSMLSDTISMTVPKYIYGSLPIKKIKEVSYKDHWLGLSIGSFVGLTTGFGAGLMISSSIPSIANNKGDAMIYYGYGITAIGLVSGGVLGWLNGFTYTYLFNP